MIGIDTNVLVRYIAQDDPTQSKKATALIERGCSEDSPGFIGHVALVEVVDAFLVAMALLVFSLGLYELIIGELNLPPWMAVHNLHDLKSKLSSLLVLVMAVKFLEKLAEWKNGLETLYFALAIAVVAAILVAFNVFGVKED